MGAKQSSPAANGRTRAYSGSDLPSSNVNVNGGGGRTAAVAMRYHGASGATSSSSSSSAAVASHYIGSRTRSVGGGSGGPGARPQSSINIPNSGAYSSQESGNSTPEENGGERERSTGTPRLLIGSLPAHLSPHLFGAIQSRRNGLSEGKYGRNSLDSAQICPSKALLCSLAYFRLCGQSRVRMLKPVLFYRCLQACWEEHRGPDIPGISVLSERCVFKHRD